MAETIKIGGELESTATGNKVADVANIKDKTKEDKSQAQINAELETALNDRYTKSETYNKTELNNMITTPNQQYVSVTANSQTTAVTDVLPATGAANTVYRVGNWDGSQFDANVYSEYAWNGSQYVHLSTKTQIGEVFDISAYHATGGTLATYADLSAALDSNNGGGVPQSLQEGGMSVKFVRTYDNKYVEYFLTKEEWSAIEDDWEKMNLEEEVGQLQNKIDGYTNYTEGYYINNNGELVEDNTACVSDVIPFSDGAKTSGAAFYFGSPKGRIVLYKDGQILGTFSEGGGNRSLTAADINNADAFRYSYDKEGADIKVVDLSDFSLLFSPTTFPSEVVKQADIIDNVVSFEPEKVLSARQGALLNQNLDECISKNNLYQEDLLLYKCLKKTENNVYISDSVDNFITPKISVTAGQVISWYHYLSNSTDSACRLGCYNSNDECIADWGTVSDTDSRTGITIPQNASYILATMYLGKLVSGPTRITDNSGNILWSGLYYQKNQRQYIEEILTKNNTQDNKLSDLELYSDRYANDVTLFLSAESNALDAKLGNGIDRLKLTGIYSTYQYYISSYTDENYSQGQVNGPWKYVDGIEELANQNLYYTIHIVRRDSGSISPSDIQNISVIKFLPSKSYIVKPDGLLKTKAQLQFGNSVNPTSNKVFGLELSNTCVSLNVLKLPNTYQYWVHGYNDAEFREAANLVYKSGWQFYPKKFIFEDTSLYYVLNIIRRDSADVSFSDLENVIVYVERQLTDSFAAKKQGNPYYNDINIVPEYYFEGNYLPMKVSTINTLLRGCLTTGDAFIFITDEHWYKSGANMKISPNLMRYIIKNTLVDKILDGGDRYDGYDTQFVEKCFAALKNENFYPVVGNHEFIINNDDENDAYAGAFQHLDNNALVSWGPEGELSYYVDNNVKKIRYIFLQSMVPTGSTPQVTLGYPAATITWLENVALAVSSGWTIVVVTHYLAYCDDTNKTIAPPPNNETWSSYYQVYNILKDYDGDGIIACILHGHAHWDTSLVVNGAKNNFPIIVTTSDRYNMVGVGHQEDRVPGTITEQAFDVVVLDKDQRKITCVRIGAPAWTDYTQEDWGKAEIREFTY